MLTFRGMQLLASFDVVGGPTPVFVGDLIDAVGSAAADDAGTLLQVK